MGMLIREMLDSATWGVITSNFTSIAMQQEDVIQIAKEVVKKINMIELYPDYKELINRFNLVQEKHPEYSHRPEYLWKMIQTGYQLTTLNLSDAYFLESTKIKNRMGLLTILLDDTCDIAHNKEAFDQCVLALNGQVDSDETGLYTLIADAASAFHRDIENAPNYSLLKPALEAAYQKWVDSFYYSLLIQEESFRITQSWENHLEIIAHSGTVYLVGLIDLLFVPNISSSDISLLTEISLRMQQSVQVKNWVTSWERELRQQDYTSGVISVALNHHLLDWANLKNDTKENIKQVIQNSSIEENLWNECKRLRTESQQLENDTQSLWLKGYVESFSALEFIQYASTEIR